MTHDASRHRRNQMEELTVTDRQICPPTYTAQPITGKARDNVRIWVKRMLQQ